MLSEHTRALERGHIIIIITIIILIALDRPTQFQRAKILSIVVIQKIKLYTGVLRKACGVGIGVAEKN